MINRLLRAIDNPTFYIDARTSHNLIAHHLQLLAFKRSIEPMPMLLDAAQRRAIRLTPFHPGSIAPDSTAYDGKGLEGVPCWACAICEGDPWTSAGVD